MDPYSNVFNNSGIGTSRGNYTSQQQLHDKFKKDVLNFATTVNIALNSPKRFDNVKATKCVINLSETLDREFAGLCIRNNQGTIAQLEDVKSKIEAIQTSNPNEFGDNQHLKDLSIKVNNLITEGTLKQVFQVKPESFSVTNALASIPKALFDLLTNRIAEKIKKQVYKSWEIKENYQKLFAEKQEELKNRYIAFQERNEKKISNNKKLTHRQKERQEKELKETVDDEFKKLPKTAEKQVEKDPQGAKFAEFKKKGIETRGLLTSIGGKRVELGTSDGVKLDATFLSADKFRVLMKNNGGGVATYQIGDSQYSGISFPKEGYTVLGTLRALNLVYENSGKLGSGYGVLFDPASDRCVIMKYCDLLTLKLQNKVTEDVDTGAFILESERYQRGTKYSDIFSMDDDIKKIEKSNAKLQYIQLKGEEHLIPAVSQFVKLESGVKLVSVMNQNGSKVFIQKEKAEELFHLKKLNKIIHNQYTWAKESDAVIREATQQDPSWKIQHGGVCILTSGNAGVYEMHKGEALALLMAGCDVMLVNPRGTGESQGKPSAQGNYKDIEAAYQYVKTERQGLPNSKITAMGLCLNGGTAAYLAEKHKGVNLFLNQTYAEFWNIVEADLEKAVDGYLRKKVHTKHDQSKIRSAVRSCILPIIKAAVHMIAPNYSTKNRLPNVKGKILIMEAKDDALMKEKEVKQMKVAFHSKKTCSHVVIPGGHSSAWDKAMEYWGKDRKVYTRSDFMSVDIKTSFSAYLPVSVITCLSKEQLERGGIE